ncbi:probable E3 ubiquitin-protein ligase RHC2A [Neltuma alba]|uniref:probable E3 ubiquitin-protein ligase RHC2A n=1 Tax=Neltuma alba TaxID=207710 RepID=UPI0010A30119|nr:probable E3 ubiquitin-protein ligase RHC2A [Prosopis alba]
MSAGASSYWCYRCSRFVRVRRQDVVVCPDCDSGFVEEIEQMPRPASIVDSRPRRFPAASMYMIGNNHQNSGRTLRPALRRARRSGGDISMVNPVVVLRGSPNRASHDSGGGHGRGFELYYEDGPGSGLRPLPPNMSEILLGSGIDRLLEQLSQIEMNGISRYEPPPVSKAAIDSLPTIEIHESHLATESHCAVCMEPFELGTTARELPCRHIYHSECILPWLALRNTCPVCRQELPADTQNVNGPVSGHSLSWNDDDNVGLTIWRLPGGGFAVGRFAGGRRSSSDRELPVVYTEMDGGLGNGGEPRRVTWSTTTESRGRDSSGGGGFRKMFRNLFGCFSPGARAQFSASSSSSSSSSPEPRTFRSNISRSRPIVNTTMRSRRTWSLDGNGGTRPW